MVQAALARYEYRHLELFVIFPLWRSERLPLGEVVRWKAPPRGGEKSGNFVRKGTILRGKPVRAHGQRLRESLVVLSRA